MVGINAEWLMYVNADKYVRSLNHIRYVGIFILLLFSFIANLL